MTIQQPTTLPIPESRPRIKALAAITDVIGPRLRGDRADIEAPVNLNAIVVLLITCALAILIIAVAQGAGRRGQDTFAVYAFWAGSVLMLVPMAFRISLPVLARGERLFLLVMLGEFLYVYKVINSPTGFHNFDEMLHWMTAFDVLHRESLFLQNSLLPISPFYPALELVTTALANLLGVDVFPAGVLTIALFRGTFLLALFLLFERMTGSARIAAIGGLVYMGCSTFATFNAGFSYESMAVVLVAVAMLAETRVVPTEWRSFIVLALVFATLCVTHHMSALWCALYMTALFTLHALQRERPRWMGITAVIVGVGALALPLLWMGMRGNPMLEYMGPVLERGIDSLITKLNGSGSRAQREMFVGADGAAQPLGNQIIGILATVLITIGLTTGFFRTLAFKATTTSTGWGRLWAVARRRWGDSRFVLLSLGAFGFPVSVVFRLSANGWEIGNRMNTFAFFSVGLVLAIAIVHYWQTRTTRSSIFLVGGALSSIVLSGLILGSGPRAVHSQYKVAADADSVEPMGISAALWTKEWLGPGSRFVADRVNRVILATYGDQYIISALLDGIDETPIFLNKKVTPDTLYPIRKGKIEYLLVDLRLTTDLAVLGEYYELHEDLGGAPPLPEVLLKFDTAPDAARVFDNGYIVIYNVSKYNEQPKK